MKPGDIEIDFDERPYIAVWEVTQACDLACQRSFAPFELLGHGRHLHPSRDSNKRAAQTKLVKMIFVPNKKVVEEHAWEE